MTPKRQPKSRRHGHDTLGVGEHHRADFAIASPAVVLAAVAEATERIRLTSTATVLSTADPVKVFEDFTALDLVSGGRAEITAGRGAYTESFPLFGFDLADYDQLFDEARPAPAPQPQSTRHLVGSAPSATRGRQRVPASCGTPRAGVDRRRWYLGQRRARRA
jgi:alkanesulfonate monooxygenase SsuD/methylene tetrahydromethanopterin reductase-like flavin-dependent oxidoreductase (luciferase family)